MTNHSPNPIAYYILAGAIVAIIFLLNSIIKQNKSLPKRAKGEAWREFKSNLTELFYVAVGIAGVWLISFIYFAFFHACFFGGSFELEDALGPSIFLAVLALAGMGIFSEATNKLRK